MFFKLTLLFGKQGKRANTANKRTLVSGLNITKEIHPVNLYRSKIIILCAKVLKKK